MSHFPRTRPQQPELQPNTVARLWHPGMIALAAAMALSACNDKDSPIKANSAPPASAPASMSDAPQPQPAAYVPPGADALYRMVAPIALYPDKLVAQILAGATYPDQIGAAETWLGQNPGLQKTALSNAVNAQNWDPSVKSLTQFPNVLEQLASNLPWTTALGKAYYNDPSDVMNAIQVMRNRAYKAGTLKTSSQLKVNLASAPAAVAYTPGVVVTPLPDPVIEPPDQFIEISPSQVDTVYVPQYDPAAVYGEPLPVYGGYRYVEVPPPAPVAGLPVMAGLMGFGTAIVLAGSMDRHPSWGWNAWNMHWGDPERPWRHGDRPPPPQARPAVVYNNTTYISQSRTVVQNIHRTDNTYIHSIHENATGERREPAVQPQSAGVLAGPGTMAAGAAVGAAAMAAGGHGLNQRQPAQSPLATQLPGRPGFAQGPNQAPNQAPGGPRASNGNALMPPQDPHDRHPPQAPQMQAAMAEKAMQQRPQEPTQRQQAMQQVREQQERQRQAQMQQQQRAQEQAQRQQQMQQGRDQQEHRQQAQMQQMQQQHAQEQAQRQQQMQQARDQQEHRQQAQMQQMQQQHAQEQAQRQQQMQQAREQQERQQQAQMQQQRAQEQAQRQQKMQQAREQQERQQQAQMQQQRAQEQAQRQQQMQQQAREQQEHRQQAQMQQMQQQRAQEQAQRQQQMQQERQQQAQMQQQRAQEQAQRQQQAQMQAQQHQAEQQARMQAARAEGRSRGDREHR